MGFFDKTICDCCVCPMQGVMQQITDLGVFIDTTSGNQTVVGQIISADNFIANTSEGSVPICNVTGIGGTLGSVDINEITLKPISIDNKGECRCCEDPATNELQSLTNEEVEIEYVGGSNPIPVTGIVSRVGEGIVILAFTFDPTSINRIISTCQITRINPNR
ncbi:hypothetical protein [Chengkuizengella axinellae]|uniref:Spore coat protein n=1 Tax=Chengkuizengella axinellae TaxID=3064388 RepID=A0ABT9J1E4_9BACL|nr:hypothetical protein [Chengkuizengella sp. 2205SS18-9]MDP5275434.1 hypothetical protein [Chengkuizengella sp. 2205SS18-9]